MRYAARPGDFIISVMTLKRGKPDFEHHVITRVPNGYAWLTGAAGGDTNLKISEEERAKILRDDFLTHKLATAPTIPELIKKDKKGLGVKASRYVAYQGVGGPKVTMPQFTKTSGSVAGSVIVRRQAISPLDAIGGKLGTAASTVTSGVGGTKDSIMRKYFKT